MNDFTFYSPTLFAFGKEAEKEVGKLVRRFGGSKVMLLYGGGSIRKNGVYDAVTGILRESGLPYVELSGIRANPRSGKVYEGIELARRERVDFLLAVGGGSIIDTAKSIGIGMPYKGDFWDFYAGKAKPEASVPVGVVLTIPASGSEGSDSAVITHENGMLKWGIPKTDVIRPRFAVMNPRFTYSLSPYQTACGASDILAHITERYFSNTPDVNLTDQMCEALMRTVIRAARTAVENRDDYASHADLMWAGMLAHNNLCGVGREQDWGSHMIEHELSALYDCAHGAGMALVLPAWMTYVMPRNVMRFAQFAVNVFGCEMNYGRPEETAKQGIARVREFFRSIGMPMTLKDVGADAKDIPAMISHRAEKPGGFPFGAFQKIGPQEMEEILRLCE